MPAGPAPPPPAPMEVVEAQRAEWGCLDRRLDFPFECAHSGGCDPLPHPQAVGEVVAPPSATHRGLGRIAAPWESVGGWSPPPTAPPPPHPGVEG